MPLTDVEICNLALGELGEYTISALTEQSKAARYCRRFYEPTVQELLREHPYRFARARATLAPDTDEPEFEWAYQHTLPATCLRVFKVGRVAQVPYTIEGRKLLTDEEAPEVYYVKRVPEADFDPLFVTALSLRIATRICMAMTDNATLYETLTKQTANALNAAKGVSGLEAPPEAERESEWVEARY